MDFRKIVSLTFWLVGWIGLISFSFLQQSYAQTKIVLLKEHKTKSVIPYANVLFDTSKFGTYSNHLGCFPIPESIKSFTISAIGFETLQIKTSELAKNDTSTIFLNPTSYTFETVTIEAKAYKEEVLGYDLLPMPLNRIRYASWSDFGSTIAIQLVFPESETPRFIKELEIALYDNPFDSTLIRFSLKKVDERGYPGDLVYQSLVIVNYDKTNRWISHTLENDLFQVTEPKLYLVVENFMPETDSFSLFKPKFSFLFHHRKKPKTPIYISNPDLKKWFYSRKQVVFRVMYLTE